MKEEKTMKVNAIKDGTVIDHIPSKSLFKVLSILKLDKVDNPVTFGNNLESTKLGSKAIIKIADVFFKDEEINKIALIAPDAKLNIIQDYQVVEKKTVTVPDQVLGFVKCYNPKCITNHENIKTKFDIISKKDILLRCAYCEKIIDQEHIQVIA